jgi:hypothetical protein
MASASEDPDSDTAYFLAHRDARTRIRLPFPLEFPRRFLKAGAGRQAIVIVAVHRDAQTGEPTTRARALTFAPGGNG